MTVKENHGKILVGYTILLYIWFALVNGFDFTYISEVDINIKTVLFIKPVFSLLFYILSLVVSSSIPSEWKHIIIYFRLKDPLPGSRIFTQLIKKDSRVSYRDIVAKYGPLPKKPKEQNVLWYKIYKEKQSDEVVKESHWKWLLFREMFITALLGIWPLSIFTFIYSGIIKGLFFTTTLILLIGLLWICARNAGNRFACNVLVR